MTNYHPLVYAICITIMIIFVANLGKIWDWLDERRRKNEG